MTASHQTGTIASGDVDIFYRRFGSPGSKTPIIIVHGLSFFSYDWIEVAGALAQDREVVAMDMRGFGNSSASPTKDYGIPAMAQDVKALAAGLGWSEWITMGHSMGGRISAYVASEYADQVKQLILVDYSPESLSTGVQRTAAIVGNQPDSFPSVDDAMQYFGVDPKTEAGQAARPRFEAYLRQTPDGYQVKRDLHFRDQFKKVLQTGEAPKRGIDMWDVFGKIKCPTLVIRGSTSDMFAADTVAKVKATISSLTFAEVDAGHDVAGDNSPALLDVIRPFVDAAGSNDPSVQALLNGVRTRGIDHLALVTDDMPGTMDFYTRVLGMRLVHARRVPFERDRGQPPYDNLRHYFFDMGNDSLLAFFEYPKDMERQNRDLPGGMQHLAFSVPLASFDRLIKHVQASGVKVIGPVSLGGRFWSAYFYDNNGIRLELCTNLDPMRPGVVESVLQDEDEARAELATLFSDAADVENWVRHMPTVGHPAQA